MPYTPGEIPSLAHPSRRVRQENHRSQPGLSLALLILAAPFAASAGELAVDPTTAHSPIEDLTLANLFSTGWNEPWTKRSRGAGTPDMSLLRVQTNFLVQLFRTDLAIQQNRQEASVRGSDALTGTLEYALNRRFMLALVGNYRWFDSRHGDDEDGATVAAFARIQLLDTASSSLAMTLRAGLPSHEFQEKVTVLSFALAGWQDLAPLGLQRTGLYYHMQEETLAGPTKPGAPRHAFTYDISLARTWTSPDAFFGNATTFVEFYGRTNLDGEESGHTLVTITPGVRATFAHRHILMAGVDFPLTPERPYDRILRFTYIFNF